jgi:8-amino-7-oxononanoate synthase
MQPDPLDWIETELSSLSQQDLRRVRWSHCGPQAARLDCDGRELLNFGSNDYLGLASDPRLSQAAARASEEAGWGSGASPLVVGRTQWHGRLEQRLAEFEHAAAAILFSTGFAANQSTIPALVSAGDAIFGDQLNHASIIDGCRLSRADVHVYPHLDLAGLRSLLAKAGHYRRRLIVTDSVFSMDGDMAPLGELCDLAESYDCMLMVDEAHATGVFGANGRGVAELQGVEERIPIRIGTLSKALGCSGGFVCGSQNLIEWLANRARSYVFSTAPPPATCAAALAALEIVIAEPERRKLLLSRADQLRQQLRQQGWNLGTSLSQIIPLIVGEAARALDLAKALREAGLFVPAIRPPSVPAGQALLRISLSYAHTDDMLATLVDALGRLRVRS